jgi:hypothetical protein
MYSTQLFEWHQSVNQKRRFNPANKKDREEYKHFLEKKAWKSPVCPFVLEWPYLTIPDMINDKLTHYMLGAKKRWFYD